MHTSPGLQAGHLNLTHTMTAHTAPWKSGFQSVAGLRSKEKGRLNQPPFDSPRTTYSYRAKYFD